MKRILFLFSVYLQAIAMYAIPSCPTPQKVQQPDGSYVTVCLHGDEYIHFNTTTDGYSVVKNAKGTYVYARQLYGELVPTDFVAHDEGMRSDTEISFLGRLGKSQRPTISQKASENRNAEMSRRAKALEKRRAGRYDYHNFKGLILLVEYDDCPFSMDNYSTVINEMVNSENYQGYRKNGVDYPCTGSVRDYYFDNSDGLFSPHFDIVGPVHVSRSKYFVEGTKNVEQLTYEAIVAADSQVDFSEYDTDNDGTVDMVYFIFSGAGSNISGNDSRLLWPHASTLVVPGGPWGYQAYRKDGVYLGRYACSTELNDRENTDELSGIGVMCHEFGHVLGLPDFYDADYEGSGGESNHPGDWSIMAAGGYLNNGRTPAGYTLYERYAVGFATPKLISTTGTFNLQALGETNSGYRINSGGNNEFFLLENRQNSSKWDRYLPYHGMLVFRVDSTNTKIWRENAVNNNPAHNYFELVRAGGNGKMAGYDSFPGYGNVKSLDNTTSPANLLTWSGLSCPLGLENISETDGVITFEVVDNSVLRRIELAESYWLGVGVSRKLSVTCIPSDMTSSFSWNSSDNGVAIVDDQGQVTGVSVGKAVITVTSANGLTTQTTINVEDVYVADNIAAFNTLPTGQDAIVRLIDAQVTYVNNNDIYLRDESGAVVMRNIGFTLNTNDVLNGIIYARVGKTNGLPIMMKVGDYTEPVSQVEVGAPVVPIAKKVADLGDADLANLIQVKGVRLSLESDGLWLSAGSNRIRVYNAFSLKNLQMPTEYEGKFFDITGIYSTRLLKGKLINEIALVASPVEVAAPDAIADVVADDTPTEGGVYNLKGQRVGSDYRGIVVTRDGRKVLNGQHMK